MEVITIQSEAFAKILEELKSIQSKLDLIETPVPLEERWLTIEETCKVLKICKRTCQSYRDSGILPYSKHKGKIHIKASDIQSHLEKNYTGKT